MQGELNPSPNIMILLNIYLVKCVYQQFCVDIHSVVVFMSREHWTGSSNRVETIAVLASSRCRFHIPVRRAASILLRAPSDTLLSASRRCLRSAVHSCLGSTALFVMVSISSCNGCSNRITTQPKQKNVSVRHRKLWVRTLPTLRNLVSKHADIRAVFYRSKRLASYLTRQECLVW